MNKCLRPGLVGWQYWNPKSLRAGAGVEFWLQEAETYLMDLSFTHRSVSACVFWTEEQWWKIQGESHLKILVSEWVSQSTSVVSDSLRPYRLYSPWHSPGQNTGLGSLSLLHGIFPTQESNPDLPHCRQIFYQLSHKGKPKNTGVGSLSLLQWIFPIQESNRGLPHWRQILYQLSYQGIRENPYILQKRKIENIFIHFKY